MIIYTIRYYRNLLTESDWFFQRGVAYYGITIIIIIICCCCCCLLLADTVVLPVIIYISEMCELQTGKLYLLFVTVSAAAVTHTDQIQEETQHQGSEQLPLTDNTHYSSVSQSTDTQQYTTNDTNQHQNQIYQQQQTNQQNTATSVSAVGYTQQHHQYNNQQPQQTAAGYNSASSQQQDPSTQGQVSTDTQNQQAWSQQYGGAYNQAPSQYYTNNTAAGPEATQTGELIDCSLHI